MQGGGQRYGIKLYILARFFASERVFNEPVLCRLSFTFLPFGLPDRINLPRRSLTKEGSNLLVKPLKLNIDKGSGV